MTHHRNNNKPVKWQSSSVWSRQQTGSREKVLASFCMQQAQQAPLCRAGLHNKSSEETLGVTPLPCSFISLHLPLPFLTSARLALASDSSLNQHYMKDQAAHTRAQTLPFGCAHIRREVTQQYIPHPSSFPPLVHLLFLSVGCQRMQ